MKILYLFNTTREGIVEKVKDSGLHDDHFYGMFRLRRFGFTTDFLEIEGNLPRFVVKLLRKWGSVYFIHLPVFYKLLRADIVFTPTAFGSQLLHALLRLKRPKWVMYDFSITGLIGEGRTLRQRVMKWLTARASGIVTIGRTEAEELTRMLPHLKERIAFIRFGTDLTYFMPSTLAEREQIFMPGFSPERDHETLFEAVKGMQASVVVSRSRKMEGAVLPLNVRAEELSMAEFLYEAARSKVIVLPLLIGDGRNEASGCSTIVEMMAMGKAIVTTRTPTLESYVEDGVNGIFVPPGDAVALRRAIEELLRDEGKRKRLGTAARRFVEQHCDADKQAETLASFFRKI